MEEINPLNPVILPRNSWNKNDLISVPTGNPHWQQRNFGAGSRFS